MRKLISSMSGGQKGFTLIELLVVIAILGVIAAIVALNVGVFFGRGTLQAANTELHQAQTAIIAAMADAQNNQIAAAVNNVTQEYNTLWTGLWSGEAGSIVIIATDGNDKDASNYVYGPFRAAYEIDANGAIIGGWCSADDEEAGDVGNPWGPRIIWGAQDSWVEA